MWKVSTKLLSLFSTQYKRILQSLPSYQPAMHSFFKNEYLDAESHLIELKQQAETLQNPMVLKEVLEIQAQIYQMQNKNSELMKVHEEIFFTLFSHNSIYNDENQKSLKRLLQIYFKEDVMRGVAFMEFVKEQFNAIPLAYQKECLAYGGTLHLLIKNFKLAKQFLTESIENGAKDELLGMCLNNVAVSEMEQFNKESSEISIIQNRLKEIFEQNIVNLTQSILAFEGSLISKKEQSLPLYNLIEQTENTINPKTINAIIDSVTILNPESIKAAINLVDNLINYQATDKASAWLKVVFRSGAKLNSDESQIEGFGRSLILYSKLQMISQQNTQAEKVILDFLESNQPRKSFLQLSGLTQYSFILRSEQRNYEADCTIFLKLEYEKQAIAISTEIEQNAYLREQIILI